MKRKNKSEMNQNEEKKIGSLFSLEHAKTKRNRSRFASFCFEAKKSF
jgi:hypothetical protein